MKILDAAFGGLLAVGGSDCAGIGEVVEECGESK